MVCILLIQLACMPGIISKVRPMTDTEDCPEALVQQHSGVWSLETIKHALIDCPAVFGTKVKHLVTNSDAYNIWKIYRNKPNSHSQSVSFCSCLLHCDAFLCDDEWLGI